jgi:CheY-like chemotaxis protein
VSSRAILEEGVPLILLIEDDVNDVFFFRRTLSKLGYHADVRVVASNGEARRYMLNEGEFANAVYYRRPDLIVSDFRLADDTALGFVQWLRSSPQFNDIPIVMLSGAVSRMDPALFVGLAVKSFVRKTADVTVLGSSLQPLLP